MISRRGDSGEPGRKRLARAEDGEHFLPLGNLDPLRRKKRVGLVEKVDRVATATRD